MVVVVMVGGGAMMAGEEAVAMAEGMYVCSRCKLCNVASFMFLTLSDSK